MRSLATNTIVWLGNADCSSLAPHSLLGEYRNMHAHSSKSLPANHQGEHTQLVVSPARKQYWSTGQMNSSPIL